MHDDALRLAYDAIVERESHRVGRNARGGAGRERLTRGALDAFAITEANLIKVQPQILSRLRQVEKEIMQRKIVQDQNPGILHHRFKNARVITMVVAQVIENGVKRREAL